MQAFPGVDFSEVRWSRLCKPLPCCCRLSLVFPCMRLCLSTCPAGSRSTLLTTSVMGSMRYLVSAGRHIPSTSAELHTTTLGQKCTNAALHLQSTLALCMQVRDVTDCYEMWVKANVETTESEAWGGGEPSDAATARGRAFLQWLMRRQAQH